MQHFETPAAVTAVLDIPAGRIQVIAADRADTTVEVRPADAGKSRDVRAAEQTRAEYAGGVLRVAGPAAQHQILGPSGSVEVTVQLPAGSSVEVKAAAVEFRAVGRFGDITGEGLHGAVKIDEAVGVRVTAHDSAVTVGRLTGPAEISTMKGDITIGEAVRGAVVLRTRMGDVTVHAAAGVSASLDAGTGHGRVTSALRNTGATELSIKATTDHGDIDARSL
ncbi:DUF4097 family beta strand repeat-containing protein [Dactylosporangium sp. NPDC005555]|uniref:DUF4097 family beta strand repeat-containing protein n=1 Tax=Dactylosporangium sp. NPDC005555 TaxID=3154889 RepID=UPI0033A7A3A2